jgi:selenide, water dikinase
MAPEALTQVLRPLAHLFSHQDHPALLVGLSVADDAAVYQLNAEQALIQTLDFFTPVVDDPYDYGAIAAANAMSDVYAMGGEVLLALNIGAFPADMPPPIITEILRGGAEKVREAGAIIAGGHTVTDAEPKYGLAVSGLIHPARILTKGGARPGDLLVLTKPLGTGVISTALKREVAAPAHVAGMVASMQCLNRAAAQAAQATGDIRAATDITGFGLLGHGMEMANASGCQLVFAMHQIPLLEGVTEYATQGIFPGGATNNRRFFEPTVTFAAALSEAQRMLLWDPQTSGGLLLAIPRDRVQAFQQACQDRAQACWVIGEVRDGEGITVLP